VSGSSCRHKHKPPTPHRSSSQSRQVRPAQRAVPEGPLTEAQSPEEIVRAFDAIALAKIEAINAPDLSQNQQRLLKSLAYRTFALSACSLGA
jgi:hypothetical protein